MDYGFVPVTDPVTKWLNAMVARRLPKTEMRTASEVRGFIMALNADTALHPAGDLVIGAHANSEGQWRILLYPNQVNAAGNPTDLTEFENIGQTLDTLSTGPDRRIRIDDSLIGWTAPPPTHFVHLKGCNLGKALPFLTKLKQAFGGHVLVTAPKHFNAVAERTMKNNKGWFEYMCYEFQVQTPAVPNAEGAGFHGFETRAALVAALDGVGHEYLDGISVPPADWEKWVPKVIDKTQSFYMALPLGRTVAGLNEIILRPNKKTLEGGARQFQVNEIPVAWPFAPPASATTIAAKIAALKTDMLLDARFQSDHAWPMYKRAGYASMDDYMTGHDWTWPAAGAEPLTKGRRIKYTVLLPITDNSGAKPILIFNFFPAPGAAQAAITTGIRTVDPRFFAEV
ncbi:hypothetical protein [Streptomyces sp. NPDC088794]|uniref:hypothetical protein n=1 Tax=Streptomyces sp. NPDC088794 TaxID=3365902 RepID=UPI003801B88F